MHLSTKFSWNGRIYIHYIHTLSVIKIFPLLTLIVSMIILIETVKLMSKFHTLSCEIFHVISLDLAMYKNWNTHIRNNIIVLYVILYIYVYQKKWTVCTIQERLFKVNGFVDTWYPLLLYFCRVFLSMQRRDVCIFKI